jgi:hypothetical protein
MIREKANSLLSDIMSGYLKYLGILNKGASNVLNGSSQYVTAKAIIQLDNGLEVAFLKNKVHF